MFHYGVADCDRKLEVKESYESQVKLDYHHLSIALEVLAITYALLFGCSIKVSLIVNEN